MSGLKLWISPGACSLAPHILLYEVDVPFDLVTLSVKAGFPKEYSQINPKRRVPVLQMDDNIITENAAIMTAISNLRPEKKLLGKTDLEIARTYEWLLWLSGTLHGQGYGGLWRPTRYSDEEKTYGSIQAKSRETIAECYDYIESRLVGPHAVGDAFTAVDAFLLVFYRWGNRIGFDMKSYPKYTTLVSRLAERQSVQRMAAKEGIDILSD
jgi:glutathione S-transferase